MNTLRGASCSLLILLLAHCFRNAHSHDHGYTGDDIHGFYEWAGMFETPEPMYVWTAQAKNGTQYVTPKMKMVVLEAYAATADALNEMAPRASLMLGMETCEPVESGGTILPGACYELQYQRVGHDSLTLGNHSLFCHDLDSMFVISTEGAAQLAFYNEYHPVELQRSIYYLKTEAGEDMLPIAELSALRPKNWGNAILAAFVVNLITLIGVLMLIPVFSGFVKSSPDTFALVTNSFAAGALLAAAFFLLLFEATHFIPITAERTEAQASASWGCMVLSGFIVAPIIDAAVHGLLWLITRGKPDAKQDGEHVSSRRIRIIGGILIGDYAHNFVDGFFVGAAFSVCGSAFGWVVTMSTVYHEIAQEVSDFWVLTDPKQGGLTPGIALFLNFISGTGVLVGTLIVLSMDVSNYATGMLLAFGGGVFVHVAFECQSRAYEVMTTMQMRLIWFVCFAVGASAIGLVLLDHEHCYAGGGHAHGH